MDIAQRIARGDDVIAVIGLGYVGLPLAAAFAGKAKVIGYDSNAGKIDLYKNGIDPTNELGNAAVAQTSVEFTADPARLSEAKYHIVAVPTPINFDKSPDLTPVIGASRTVGRHMSKGSIVIFESTVYPGVTEDVCAPVLEEESGLVCGRDFKIAYSPERINPGDKVHRLETIVKIVSGMDVVAAMNTKWNALGFTPGLVGGHCIGVDPYYFVYEAEKLGYHSQLITAGRRINDGMGRFVAEATIKKMVMADLRVKRAKVCVFGITFKENCPDARNTKIVDIIDVLREYDIEPIVVDPEADAEDVRCGYGIELTPLEDVKDIDCAIFAVRHRVFSALSVERIEGMFAAGKSENRVIIDVKSMMDKAVWLQKGYRYWRM